MIFHFHFPLSISNFPKPVQPNLNTGLTRVKHEPGEKPVNWARVGIDGLQLGLESTRVQFMVEPTQTFNMAQHVQVAPLIIMFINSLL